MKIGIIDADLIDNGTRHPNLALMKLSAYNKKLGYQVDLLEDYDHIPEYDQVYISKVFTFTEVPKNLRDYKNITIGGTGFFKDGGGDLDDEIEHHMPDYHLYDDFIHRQLAKGVPRKRYADYLDYSIGFTTRGCFRKCEFCVNKKYDRAFKHSPIKEFLDPTRKYIYLWDDNFLAYNGWEQILDELEDTDKRFQFRQGLDIRLMTERGAQRLSKVKYHGDYIFSFDNIEEKELIKKQLILWKKYCSKTTKLFLLTAFGSQDEINIAETFERIKILMEFGCLPYIMRYEDYKNSNFRGMYIQMARWCNQPQFFKKKSFRQFCEANQDYHKNPDTQCASYRAMLDFEKKYPDIAKKYFDLRYEDIKKY